MNGNVTKKKEIAPILSQLTIFRRVIVKNKQFLCLFLYSVKALKLFPGA